MLDLTEVRRHRHRLCNPDEMNAQGADSSYGDGTLCETKESSAS
ncbi:hypothetical protein [Bradyrhizobium cenepequi]|nr:hypothetical protein [Bradyrhizobium cenepequi]